MHSYKIVYSLCEHPYLGFVIEPHIVRLNLDGGYSMTHQHIFSNTLKEYEQFADEYDISIVALLDQLDQINVIKRFHKQKITPIEFFHKHYDAKVHDFIRPKLESSLFKALYLIRDHGKPFFMMSKDGFPLYKELQIATEKATVLFHFRRDGTETRYFPTIKYRDQRLDFMHRPSRIICQTEACLWMDNTLYFFEQNMEGKKLQPFISKKFISIPRATEQQYFERFVRPLIERYHVYAEGFEIKTVEYKAQPILKLVYIPNGTSELQLYFRYDGYTFSSEGEQRVSVRMEQQGDSYVFHRIKRSRGWEQSRFEVLQQMGLVKQVGLFSNLQLDITRYGYWKNNPMALVEWININYDFLIEQGFVIESEGDRKLYLGKSNINFDIKENNDWFDIEGIVQFGDFTIPFLQLRSHILKGNREFILPNGEVAIIPEVWFSQYQTMFQLSKNEQKIQLNRCHVGLMQDVLSGEMATVTMDRKLQKLMNFETIESVDIPEGFCGTLRPYQKAGYDWLNFLREYRFGGCLADDMGLGKTVQTLAVLQHNRNQQEDRHPSLLIAPVSLMFSWEKEAQKFTPDLKILQYSGSFRNKYVDEFQNYDLIITTYGTARIDAEVFLKYYFSYIILDESQQIKNASSKSFQAIKHFKSHYRLLLSGTPVENSVADLWSQMTFANPGLLGTENSFQSTFVQAIEKQHNEAQAQRLQSIIKPFVLRRTKEQVASELPPKIEQTVLCELSNQQEEIYEKIKSGYRNQLIEALTQEGGLGKSTMNILQGLTQLRQIANHPAMVDSEYEFGSGKFDAVIETLENVLAEKHKVLIFSQFVKHLTLFRNYLDRQNIPYSYLDGATKDRETVVETFKKNESIQIFLISIKAGGVGLNLAEADYVFVLDPWWNPAVEQQAIDRSHRIGQTRNVFVYKFISKNTVEEKILALQQRKTKLANQLITTEESFFKSLTTEDISELLL